MNNPFFVVCFYLLLTGSMPAQTNLVYNGDFEIYDTCPIGLSQPGDYQIEHCLGWRSPTHATSDYFNACNPFMVPDNSIGYQSPQSGNSYLGFLPFSWVAFPYLPWWEYAQGNLTEPLVAGGAYRLSFYVSNAWGISGVSELGAYLSATPIQRTDDLPFSNLVPQVLSPMNEFLTDSAGWTKITGEFIAQGGEQFITIGWFQDTLQFNKIYVDSSANNMAAYYYVDNVVLVELPSKITTINVFSPNGDGLNDFFNIECVSIKVLRCDIFNRWGNTVFRISAPTEIWDGTINGIPCAEGTYYYCIRAEGFDNTQINYNGFVHLVR